MFAAGFESPAFQMSFGQMSEVLFMVAMPLFFARLGVKWMLVTGMAAWVVRYFLFASAAPAGSHSLIFLGILLHGICYDFFFVTGQVYVDKKSTDDIRGQAQGFLVLVTYGVGMLLGAQVSGWVFNALVPDPNVLASWQRFWLLPGVFALAVMVFFAATFPRVRTVRDACPEVSFSSASGRPTWNLVLEDRETATVVPVDGGTKAARENSACCQSLMSLTFPVRSRTASCTNG